MSGCVACGVSLCACAYGFYACRRLGVNWHFQFIKCQNTHIYLCMRTLNSTSLSPMRVSAHARTYSHCIAESKAFRAARVHLFAMMLVHAYLLHRARHFATLVDPCRPHCCGPVTRTHIRNYVAVRKAFCNVGSPIYRPHCFECASARTHMRSHDPLLGGRNVAAWMKTDHTVLNAFSHVRTCAMMLHCREEGISPRG